jgi:hypothetical protein
VPTPLNVKVEPAVSDVVEELQFWQKPGYRKKCWQTVEQNIPFSSFFPTTTRIAQFEHFSNI